MSSTKDRDDDETNPLINPSFNESDISAKEKYRPINLPPEEDRSKSIRIKIILLVVLAVLATVCLILVIVDLSSRGSSKIEDEYNMFRGN